MGTLVAFEGIDGAGKTTQIHAVGRVLQALGHRVVITKEPTDGPHGQAIRDSAERGRRSPAEELDLFMLDREDHVRDLISPELESGAVVLVDRYYLSTVAYQGVRGFDPVRLLAQNEAFAPRPDLFVVLDLPAEIGLSRVRLRGKSDLFEDAAALEKSREVFNTIKGDHVLHLDAQRPPVQLTEEIVMQVLLICGDIGYL